MNQKTTSLNCCILFAVLIGLSLAPLGCAPTLVGQNAAVYSMGQLHARAEHDMDSVHEATVTALEQLDITVLDEPALRWPKKKDVSAARVYGETSDGQVIGIRLEPETEESTLLVIHTGVVGNELRARAIFGKINDILNPVVAGK
ncbi:MAG: DUF3568 family protein [Phycisphaerales bacterium]|nr:MAG: DUF3568 family protein [Phycisphaerales bacterium]